MENDQARFFGVETAARYDVASPRDDTEDAVAFLARVADGGPVLELGIGTGRVALPLAATGLRVDGIDISAPMVEQLSTKPGGDALAVTLGDFADVAVEGEYALVYVVFNTLGNLGTQEEQVRCFQNVATHLGSDGVFVVEILVPEPELFRERQYVRAEAVAADSVMLDVVKVDLVAQRLEESHVVFADGGVALYPVVTRFVWPSEMDLMARVAGLRLRDRWGGWRGEPFTGDSRRHVSVYAR